MKGRSPASMRQLTSPDQGQRSSRHGLTPRACLVGRGRDRERTGYGRQVPRGWTHLGSSPNPSRSCSVYQEVHLANVSHGPVPPSIVRMISTKGRGFSRVERVHIHASRLIERDRVVAVDGNSFNQGSAVSLPGPQHQETGTGGFPYELSRAGDPSRRSGRTLGSTDNRSPIGSPGRAATLGD